MEKYRERPKSLEVVEAIMFPGGKLGELFLEQYDIRVDSNSSYIMVGLTACRRGDYIVHRQDGRREVMSAALFEKQFEPHSALEKSIDAVKKAVKPRKARVQK